MKQLLIVGNSTYGSNATLTDAGKITFTNLITDSSTGKHSVLSTKATSNFAIYLGRGANILPFQIPEVDVKTMTAVKTPYSAGNAYSCKFTVPAVSANATRNQNLTIMIVKNGTVFNERNTWHFTYVLGAGKAGTASVIADWFVAQINAAGERLGITASNSGAVITLTGSDNDTNYTVTFIDDLVIAALTAHSSGSLASGEFIAAVPAIGDAAYVKKLYQECIADKGVKYLAEDGKEIYPGYNPDAINGTFNIFTIRFAVGRDSAKTRDERASQIVHIAVPINSTDYNSVTNTIEYVLGISAPAQSSGN